jgi:CheY-like chemotaxis protein
MDAPVTPVPHADIGSSAIGHGEQILVVDDEPVLLDSTVRLLRRHGYSVMQARSAQEALVVAADNEFQLVLTDLVMPNMSGHLLAAKLKALNAQLVVLFMSSYARDVLDQWGLAEDEVILIEKPFTERDLLVKISALLNAGVHS